MQLESVTNHITKWLKDYIEQSPLKGFVIGVSGGVDSALTSTICARTKLPTICVEIPIHQDKNQVTRAVSHIEWLKESYSNISSVSVPLTDSFETILKSLPKTKSENYRLLAEANIRARLRMITLYYIAGIHHSLVVGTGNKVEDFGVGFYTKYGDGGVDISPIADLLKTEVFALAKFVGVNSDILNVAPTDGLFSDERSDEDQIGASYSELEWAMNQMNKGATEKDFSGRESEVFKIYKRLNVINQHKMRSIPICHIPKEIKFKD